MPKQKLVNEQKQVIVERFKAGEPMPSLAKEYGVSWTYISRVCKNALGKDYETFKDANHAYARAQSHPPKLNAYFMQIAALIAKGTTLQEIASETGQSVQYVRWWCKEKLSEKTFNKLIENRKERLNDRKA